MCTGLIITALLHFQNSKKSFLPNFLDFKSPFKYSCLMFLPFIATTVFLVFGSQDGNNSVGLENMAKTLRGDVRLISIGDSYSSPYWSRIAPAALRVWPITNIEGICNGADLAPSLIRCTAYCEPVFNVHATDSLGYSIER